MDKIEIEYPELLTHVNKGEGSTYLDVIRAYYELKMMESQRLYSRIIMILTSVNIFLVGLIGFLTIFKPF